MGRIVAIGGGRYDDGEIENIIGHIVSMYPKSKPAVLFLPTAGYDDINGDEPIQNLFEKFGCSYSILFLTDKTLSKTEIEEKINNADIIYAGGGNLKFLMDTWNSTGASDALRKAYENGKILSGYSSGAMCWFARGYDDCGENGDFIFYDCLGILPYCNCPHYEGGNWPSFKNAVKTQEFSGIACENGAAIVFDNGTWYTLQGNDGGEVYLLDSNKDYEEIKLDSDATQLNSIKK